MDDEQRLVQGRVSSARSIAFSVLPLVLLSFLVSVGFAALNLIIPYYLLALRGLLVKPPDVLTRVSHTEMIAVEFGAMVTAFMATRTVFALFSGGFADTYGRKKLIVTGSVIYVTVAFLYALATDVWQLIALRALQGIASAIVWPVAEALLIDIVPYYYRNRALALYTMSFQAGNILGPLLGAGAYLVARSFCRSADVMMLLRMPFLITAAILLPGVATALMTPEVVARRVKRGLVKAALSFTEVFRYARGVVGKSIYAILTNSLVNGIALGMFSSVAMLFIMERVTANPVMLGVAFFTANLVGMAVAYPAARKVDALDLRTRKKVLVAAAFAARSAWLLIAFISNLWELLAALLLAQIGFSVMLPLLRTAYASLVPREMRGKAFGVQQAFFNAGMSVGPFIASMLYREWSGLTLLGGLLTGKQLVFILAALLGYLGAGIIAAFYEPLSVEE